MSNFPSLRLFTSLLRGSTFVQKAHRQEESSMCAATFFVRSVYSAIDCVQTVNTENIEETGWTAWIQRVILHRLFWWESPVWGIFYEDFQPLKCLFTHSAPKHILGHTVILSRWQCHTTAKSQFEILSACLNSAPNSEPLVSPFRKLREHNQLEVTQCVLLWSCETLPRLHRCQTSFWTFITRYLFNRSQKGFKRPETNEQN